MIADATPSRTTASGLLLDASLRVLSRRSLRAVRDYPNNIVVVDLKVSGTSCMWTFS